MFDVIVIGAGSGGLTTALGLAGLGKKVLLIEKHKMGGDCTNYGCIPSKSLIKYGKEISTIRKHGYEINTDLSNKSLDKTRAKVDEVLSHETPEVLMDKYKTLTVIKGQAEFVNKCTVKVAKENYTGKKMVIATGSESRTVEVQGLDEKHILTNKSVFDLKAVPKKLLIVGGGAIACELGEAFANLGSEVTLMVRGDKVLGNNEPEISEYVLGKLMTKGIKVHLNSTIDKVDGKKAYFGNKKIDFDKVLMAVGRVVNVEELKLEKAGVRYDKKGITTDKKNRTSTKGIYAVGDVSSKDKLTHNADHQGRNVVRHILSGLLPQQNKAMPKVVYMEDEVASVGLSYRESLKKYNQDEIFKIELDFDRVDRALTDGTNGKMIIIVKGLKGKILGANIVGPHAGEMIGLIGVAIDNGISLSALSSSVFAYPTYSRIFKKAGDDFLRSLSKNWKEYLKYQLKSKGPKVLTILFWLAILYGFFEYKDLNDKTNLQVAKDFFSFFAEPDLIAGLIFILVYAFRQIILFPATLLTVLAGALFGPIYGVIYTILGANASASVSYFLGRFLGADAVEDEGEGILSKWKSRLQSSSFESVLIMRLVYLPFDGVNYVCGLLKVKWPQYALATLIGTIPGSMSFVIFGSSIDFADFDPSMVSIDPKLLTTSGVLFVISIVVSRLVRKKENIKK